MNCSVKDWTEAICAVVMVGLTFWTIAILRRYAADTKEIAAATLDQVESGQRPFLTLEFPFKEDGIPNYREFGVIRNRGKGTALNIHFSLPNVVGLPEQWPTPLSADEAYIAFKKVLQRVQWDPLIGLIIEYDSLSRRRYRTTLRLVDWNFETHFEEINQLPARSKVRVDYPVAESDFN